MSRFAFFQCPFFTAEMTFCRSGSSVWDLGMEWSCTTLTYFSAIRFDLYFVNRGWRDKTLAGLLLSGWYIWCWTCIVAIVTTIFLLEEVVLTWRCRLSWVAYGRWRDQTVLTQDIGGSVRNPTRRLMLLFQSVSNEILLLLMIDLRRWYNALHGSLVFVLRLRLSQSGLASTVSVVSRFEL